MTVEPQIPEPLLMRFIPYILAVLFTVLAIIEYYEFKEWLWKRKLRKILQNKSIIKEI